MTHLGEWILEEATEERGERTSSDSVEPTLAAYERAGVEWFDERTTFVPTSTSRLALRADGTFEHAESANTAFGRYVPTERSVVFEETHWTGRWRTASADEAPFDVVLSETCADEVYLDRVRVEGDTLTRVTFLVWDGLYLTRTTGRYRRAL